MQSFPREYSPIYVEVRGRTLLTIFKSFAYKYDLS